MFGTYEGILMCSVEPCLAEPYVVECIGVLREQGRRVVRRGGGGEKGEDCFHTLALEKNALKIRGIKLTH
jgi:hypothetical protein